MCEEELRRIQIERNQQKARHCVYIITDNY